MSLPSPRGEEALLMNNQMPLAPTHKRNSPAPKKNEGDKAHPISMWFPSLSLKEATLPPMKGRCS